MEHFPSPIHGTQKLCGPLYVGCSPSLKMKRSHAPSSRVAGASQTTTTTVVKKAKPTYPLYRNPGQNWNSARIGQGFPKKLNVTHRWCQTLSLSTNAAGARNDFLFSCNGMFDPSFTGGAHQPLYFTQLSALYDHYTVIASKIKLTMKKSDVATNTVMYANLSINDDTTVTAGFLAQMEHPSAVKGVLNGYDDTLVLVKKWSAKQTFGGSVLGNDNLQGTITANPTEQSFFHLAVDSSVGTILTTSTMIVEIDYIAVWDELRDIANV